MGREMRRVPADWQHPQDERGRYIPLFGRSFAVDSARWDTEKSKWDEGLINDFKGGWQPRSQRQFAMDCKTFDDWSGHRPDPADYMPDWLDTERTHYMMYEDTSEGTPISPAFATPEELARWLADTGASTFANMTGTYTQWLRVCRGGYAPSAIIDETGIRSGVAL